MFECRGFRCVTECSSPAPGPGKEWEEYVQIRSLVEKIRKKQKGMFFRVIILIESCKDLTQVRHVLRLVKASLSFLHVEDHSRRSQRKGLGVWEDGLGSCPGISPISEVLLPALERVKLLSHSGKVFVSRG